MLSFKRIPKTRGTGPSLSHESTIPRTHGELCELRLAFECLRPRPSGQRRLGRLRRWGAWEISKGRDFAVGSVFSVLEFPFVFVGCFFECVSRLLSHRNTIVPESGLDVGILRIHPGRMVGRFRVLPQHQSSMRHAVLDFLESTMLGWF